MILFHAAGPSARVWDQFIGHFRRVFDTLIAQGGNLLWILFSIVVIFVLARIVLNLISKGTRKVMEDPRYHQSEFQGRRVNTVMTLLRSVARYFVYFVAALLVLGKVGLLDSMKSLLVTAGIGSIAIGLGAQSLFKDVITGFFLMFENQFSVGDYVKIDDVEGTVEATAMRVTYIRTFQGEQVIIPNGTISRVSNYSRGPNLALVKVVVPYEADTRQAMEVIRQAISQYAESHPEKILEPPFVRGVTDLTSVGVEIGVACKVKALEFWGVERGLRLAIKEAFDRQGVPYPYPTTITRLCWDDSTQAEASEPGVADAEQE